MPFAVLTILAVHRRHFVLSGIALGLMSSLKILPIVGVVAFLILPISNAQKARVVAASLLTFGAIYLVNMIISGPYGAGLFKELFGRMSAPLSPYTESSGTNPDFIDFVFRVFGAFGIEHTSLITSAIALCCLIIGASVAMLARQTETDEFATIRLFGLAYLVCMLFLFRLKPYAFAALIPFAIAAVAFPSRALRYAGYLVLVLMPWLFFGKISLIGGLTREFFQTISFLMFLLVAFGLHGLWQVKDRIITVTIKNKIHT